MLAGGRSCDIFVLMEISCPFCAYVLGKVPKELIVYEDEDVLVIPCKGQKRSNRGHCLVVTRKHISNIYELSHELSTPILAAVSAAARATKKAFSAEGISLRQNNEAASGQDVFHLHFHIVPRFSGDEFDAARYEQVDEQTRIHQAEMLRVAWKHGSGR
jgi:diadenosine tetraphosphate (Ap4A) HIT family hydrolase